MLASLITIIILTLIWIFLRNTKNGSTTSTNNRKLKQQSFAPTGATRSSNITAKPPINSDLASNKTVIEVPKELADISLITSNDMCEIQKQATLAMVRYYKKPHPMLVSLTKRYVSQQELQEIVKSDAKIAGRILFVVNSSRFGVQQPIKDINHAIMYLGLSEVRTIATELALKASFEPSNNENEQSFSRIWQISALASSISLELGKIIGRENASELSTLCLLHYVGDLILVSSNPESSYLYQNGTSFYQRVKETQLKFKTNTTLIASFAAKAWELPEAMVTEIECGLTPLTHDPNMKSLGDKDKIDIMICYLACRIAELAVFQQKANVEKMNIFNQESYAHIEFFHINNMLTDYDLTKVKNLLTANNFAYKANSLISKYVN